MLISLLRAMLIAAILIVSLAVALFVGLVLAEAGMLGTCQDGACQLVAAAYIMPFGGVALFLAALVVYSVSAVRRRREGAEAAR